MKVRPIKKYKTEKQQLTDKSDRMIYWVAVGVAAVSVYYFFIKIVFL